MEAHYLSIVEFNYMRNLEVILSLFALSRLHLRDGVYAFLVLSRISLVAVQSRY
jgi:hypothetical protein